MPVEKPVNAMVKRPHEINFAVGSVEEAPAVKESGRAITRALAVIGAWDDLDWEATAAALDRMRHERAPTPPIDPSQLDAPWWDSDAGAGRP